MLMAKYEEIANDIKSKILDGSFKKNQLIPSEKELGIYYDAGRSAVRHALGLLASQGHLVRKAGEGTFVYDSTIKNCSNHARSFTQDMIFNGKHPGSKLIEFRLDTYLEKTTFGENLHLSFGSRYFYFVRVRTGDDIPLALSYNYVPYDIADDLTPEILDGSFYEYLSKRLGDTFENHENYGIHSISAVMPAPKQRRLLKISNEPLLKITHSSSLNDGRFYEYTETYYVGSRFIYTWQ